MFLVSLSHNMVACAYTEGYFEYEVTDSSVTITGYFGRETDVTVPAMIAGNPVNTISTGAFINTTVKTLNLPDTIMTIESNAIGTSIKVVYNENLSGFQNDNYVSQNSSNVTEAEDGQNPQSAIGTVDSQNVQEKNNEQSTQTMDEAIDAVEVELDAQDTESEEEERKTESEKQDSDGIHWGVFVVFGLVLVATSIFIYLKRK